MIVEIKSYAWAKFEPKILYILEKYKSVNHVGRWTKGRFIFNFYIDLLELN